MRTGRFELPHPKAPPPQDGVSTNFTTCAVFFRRIFVGIAKVRIESILSKNIVSRIRKIVLASVLKPSDDPRMYKKIGKTLAERGYEVHTIGSVRTSARTEAGVTAHDVFRFRRLSMERAFVFFPFFRMLLRLKPDLLVVCTFELLPAACLYKILFGKKLIYDIQENYFRNILHTNVFPRLLRLPLALFVRMRELISVPFINGFIFAERCYAREMSFVPKSRSMILENKFEGKEREIVRETARKSRRFLYSGTVSEHYGIREAFSFIQKLHQVDPSVSLVVVGVCSVPKLFEELKETAEACDFIDFRVRETPIPHETVLGAIEQADAGLLPYRPNVATASRIPTKMFEYMAYTLPTVVQQNPFWKELCTPHKAAIFVDFKNFEERKLLNELENTIFYPNGVTGHVFWEKEQARLIEWIGLI